MSAILIRADGGPEIGFGHITRCRALIEAFDHFQLGFLWLTSTPDVLPDLLRKRREIISIDPAEEAAAILALARTHASPLLVGDWKETDPDLVDRVRATGLGVALLGNLTGEARADLFIRQRFEAEPESDGTPSLDGSAHLLLPGAFRDIPAKQHAGRAGRVLVSLGGSMSPLINRIMDLCSEISDTAGLELDILRPSATGTPHTAPEVAARMQAADFAILAGGTSLHEAAASRLPTLCLPIVGRQMDRARSWEACGFGASLVPETPHWEREFASQFNRFIEDAEFRTAASQRMAHHVDGHGAERIARALATRWPLARNTAESV